MSERAPTQLVASFLECRDLYEFALEKADRETGYVPITTINDLLSRGGMAADIANELEEAGLVDPELLYAHVDSEL